MGAGPTVKSSWRCETQFCVQWEFIVNEPQNSYMYLNYGKRIHENVKQMKNMVASCTSFDIVIINYGKSHENVKQMKNIVVCCKSFNIVIINYGEIEESWKCKTNEKHCRLDVVRRSIL